MKLFVDEPGSVEVSEIWSRARLTVSSRILYPEARAAVAAAMRSGRTGSKEATELRKEIEGFWEDLACVEVSPAVAARAGDLAEEHSLRGFDAVHLSSALEVDVPEAVFVTGDDRLSRAAEALGLTTARLPAQSSEG